MFSLFASQFIAYNLCKCLIVNMLNPKIPPPKNQGRDFAHFKPYYNRKDNKKSLNCKLAQKKTDHFKKVVRHCVLEV